LPLEVKTNGNNELVYQGISGDHQGLTGKVRYQGRVKILTNPDNLMARNDRLEVRQADSVLLIISLATNFVRYDNLTGNPEKKAEGYLAGVTDKTYQSILNDHVKAYQHYFHRVAFDLGVSEAAQEETDVRVRNFGRGLDPGLAALYFQFGRYLLISGSQPGGQPANLQGLWNDQTDPPWGSNYTLDINAEMNYWPAEVTNLAELTDPLVQMVRELSETGRETARVIYGSGGWVVHHCTDIWRATGAVGGSWGVWPVGQAWLCQHLWEKYAYSGDKNFLESVYPVMKGAAEFFTGYLVEEPTHGWLVTCPSGSPENYPKLFNNSCISMGVTMDNQLVFDLFDRTIQAAGTLGKDREFVQVLKDKIKRLPPMQIGHFGQLQEWLFDWDDPADTHSHVSHLYGVYPSAQISPDRTPQLFAAARTSLLHRGDVSTGWSMGWKVNLWARFLDGNHAFKLITDQLTLVEEGKSSAGGTYPNLFDAHPPFQIDGNFGCTAGIAEMLLQSHDGVLFILPALPDAWKSGKISGLRARGGFVVDITWENGKVRQVKVKSEAGGNCRIRSYDRLKAAAGLQMKVAEGSNPNPFYRMPDVQPPLVSPMAKIPDLALPARYTWDFDTRPGQTYSLLSDVQ
jgi:alpha-L-fucosidase 2